jgi:hypothetical protein
MRINGIAVRFLLSSSPSLCSIPPASDLSQALLLRKYRSNHYNTIAAGINHNSKKTTTSGNQNLPVETIVDEVKPPSFSMNDWPRHGHIVIEAHTPSFSKPSAWTSTSGSSLASSCLFEGFRETVSKHARSYAATTASVYNPASSLF